MFADHNIFIYFFYRRQISIFHFSLDIYVLLSNQVTNCHMTAVWDKVIVWFRVHSRRRLKSHVPKKTNKKNNNLPLTVWTAKRNALWNDMLFPGDTAEHPLRRAVMNSLRGIYRITLKETNARALLCKSRTCIFPSIVCRLSRIPRLILTDFALMSSCWMWIMNRKCFCLVMTQKGLL